MFLLTTTASPKCLPTGVARLPPPGGAPTPAISTPLHPHDLHLVLACTIYVTSPTGIAGARRTVTHTHTHIQPSCSVDYIQ